MLTLSAFRILMYNWLLDFCPHLTSSQLWYFGQWHDADQDWKGCCLHPSGNLSRTIGYPFGLLFLPVWFDPFPYFVNNFSVFSSSILTLCSNWLILTYSECRNSIFLSWSTSIWSWLFILMLCCWMTSSTYSLKLESSPTLELICDSSFSVFENPLFVSV